MARKEQSQTPEGQRSSTLTIWGKKEITKVETERKKNEAEREGWGGVEDKSDSRLVLAAVHVKCVFPVWEGQGSGWHMMVSPCASRSALVEPQELLAEQLETRRTLKKTNIQGC